MEFLFALKKLISLFIMPLSMIILLLITALFFYHRSEKLSYRCLVLGTVILIASSLPVVSDQFMAPLENNYEAFTKAAEPIDYIVILGCGHVTDHSLPATSQLRACSLQRMVEALRIHQLYPQVPIITSGHGGDDDTPNAEMVKQALIELGISEQLIITENYPKDTEEEAELIGARVKDSTVVLITNSQHMPRSMKYFQRQGVNVIAAPASPWVKDYYGDKGWGYYVPSSHSLYKTTHAWYESIGRLVQWLKGLFD